MEAQLSDLSKGAVQVGEAHAQEAAVASGGSGSVAPQGGGAPWQVAGIGMLANGGAGLIIDGPGGMAILPVHPDFVAETFSTQPDLPSAELIESPGAAELSDMHRVDGLTNLPTGAQGVDGLSDVDSTGPDRPDFVAVQTEAESPGPVTDSLPTDQSPLDAPAQIPTTDGAHLTTAPDSAGERSVAFNPMSLGLADGLASGSSLTEWLRIDELMGAAHQA